MLGAETAVGDGALQQRRIGKRCAKALLQRLQEGDKEKRDALTYPGLVLESGTK